jgi:hypothetical protein
VLPVLVQAVGAHSPISNTQLHDVCQRDFHSICRSRVCTHSSLTLATCLLSLHV